MILFYHINPDIESRCLILKNNLKDRNKSVKEIKIQGGTTKRWDFKLILEYSQKFIPALKAEVRIWGIQILASGRTQKRLSVCSFLHLSITSKNFTDLYTYRKQERNKMS